jgi:TRAP-type mannitol/chloroaromatic compound transport system permease large subunit
MTDPVDHEAPAAQPPPDPGVSQPAPAVAWAAVPSAGETPGTTGQRRVMDVVVWVVALAALVLLSLGRAGLSGATGSERIGYALGAAVGALLVATAVRWLWLRFRRRNDPTKRLLSPWIAIGAVIFAALTIGTGRN